MAVKKGRAKEKATKDGRPITRILKLKLKLLLNALDLNQLLEVARQGGEKWEVLSLIDRPEVLKIEEQRQVTRLIREKSKEIAGGVLNDIFDLWKKVKLPSHTDEPPVTVEQIKEVERYLWRVNGKRFVRKHLEDVRRVVREFNITLTDEEAWKILGNSWHPYCDPQCHDLEESTITTDREYLRWMERHYNALLTILFADLYMCRSTTWQVAQEVSLILGVIDALKVENERAFREKKRMKFNKAQDSKRAVWNVVIYRIVEAAKPLCKRRDRRIAGTGRSKEVDLMPACDFTARLLETCYPATWTGVTSERIRARYTRLRDTAGSILSDR